jgi:hypothetical protein
MAAEDAGLTPGGVALETVIDPREQVLADPDQLHRILTNLLRNAREAIEGAPDRGGKGRVFVELRRGEGLSILRLSDDGPGVPQRAQPTCSSRSSARCGEAARAWAWPSPASWPKATAETSCWLKPVPGVGVRPQPGGSSPNPCRNLMTARRGDVLNTGERPWPRPGPSR